MPHHGDPAVKAPSAEKEEAMPKKARIHHRRVEENLPLFGKLVERADPYELRYHEHEDARNIELFFDLFFVAIFSTFTKNHEINSNESLASYAVYFGVIWASWLQICLYDVRFGCDSIFERFTKAVQMCMFIGFASSTSSLQMDAGKDPKTQGQLSGFDSLNVLMIISRALFALQYTVALILIGRKHKRAEAPLTITSGMYAVAALIYTFLFKFLLVDKSNVSGFYGYYAIITFELGVISLLAYRYPCVSFTHTHIHKRLMVLTLMILGEGIIVCAFGFAKISSKAGWTANSFGQALCVILTIYFIYCLYFGNSGIERAGAFRPAKQQIYTLLHWPFHLCLALTLEGLRTWTIIANVQYNFRKIYGYIDAVIGRTPDVYRLQELNATTGGKIVDTLNKTIVSFGFDKAGGWTAMQTALGKMRLAWLDDAATIASPVPGQSGVQNKSAVLDFYFTELVSLVQNEQFIANNLLVPDVQVKAAKGSGVAQMQAYFAVFKMIFIYFFTCTAFVIFALGIFRSMSIGPRDRYDSIMITVRMAMGLLLGMLGLLALMNQHITSYMNSNVLLPTLLFVLLFIVLFEKGLTNFALRFGQSHGLDGHPDAEYAPLDEKVTSSYLLAKDAKDFATYQSVEKMG